MFDGRIREEGPLGPVRAFTVCLAARSGTLFYFAASAVLVIVVCALRRVPLDPVLYALLLAAVAGLILLAVDFAREYGRYRRIWAIHRQSTRVLPELPPPCGLMQEAYRSLALRLERDRRAAASEIARRETESARYYTMWVHQIKTPIAAMQLLIQENRQADFAGALRQELFKVEQYAEMVLQYHRLGGGERDLVLERCDIAAIVRAAVRRTAALFIGRRIMVRADAFSLTAVTDEKWMIFVFEQLLTNAVKYTPCGGTVHIGLCADREDTVVVEDTGIGISPQDLPRIFDWGFTGYNGRIEERSTGIGLFLCRQALSLLGHTIGAESHPGEGTRIYIGLRQEKYAL